MATQTYTYTAQPQTLAATQRYRPYNENQPPKRYIANIMHDKRVVRGATVKPVKSVEQVIPVKKHTTPRTQRPYEIRTNVLNDTAESKQQELASTYKLDDRHIITATQTDTVYDELDDTIYTAVHSTQTDTYISEQPTVPVFATRVVGIDAQTQILPNELFNFDTAITSILSVLCGKTLSQAYTEVQQETELEQLRQNRLQWEYQRNLLIQEAQRLEAITKRNWHEKELRKQAELQRVQNEITKANELTAATVAQQVINEMNDRTLEQMNAQNLLPDLLEQYIQHTYMPNVIQQVTEQLHQYTVAQHVVDDMLHNAVQHVHNEYQQYLDAQYTEQQRLQQLNDAAVQQSIVTETTEQRIERELQAKWAAEVLAEQQAIEQARIEAETEAARLQAEQEAENGASEDEES